MAPVENPVAPDVDERAPPAHLEMTPESVNWPPVMPIEELELRLRLAGKLLTPAMLSISPTQPSPAGLTHPAFLWRQNRWGESYVCRRAR
jgi:hypothetical protein